MSELICGAGKTRDRGEAHAEEAESDGPRPQGLGASGRVWAGRQFDVATGITYDRGYARVGSDVLEATCDSGERSHTVRRAAADWGETALRLDAVPGGPKMHTGECSERKQQYLHTHSAVVLPSLSGGGQFGFSPLRSTARAMAATRLSPTRLSPMPAYGNSTLGLHAPGVNVTTKMSYGNNNRPLRMGRRRPGFAEAPGVFDNEARCSDMAERMRAQKWNRHKQQYEWVSDYDV